MPINQTVPSGDYEFDFESRITGGDFTEEDGENELSLRPKTLDEYVGQEKVKENLSVFINAAKIRGDALDLMMGKGPAARSIRIPLKPFTLIGATTRAGQLSSPLRDRFGMLFRLELYTNEELARIVTRSASILGAQITEGGAFEIARRSRGTPRIANRFLKRVRDFALVLGDGKIDESIADRALRSLDVDELGLDAVDRRMLAAIIKHFGGGPVGLETLAAVIGEESVTLEDVYEPYLLQLGFLNRTPRGRMATASAYTHLGLRAPEGIMPSQMQINTEN